MFNQRFSTISRQTTNNICTSCKKILLSSFIFFKLKTTVFKTSIAYTCIYTLILINCSDDNI